MKLISGFFGMLLILQSPLHAETHHPEAFLKTIAGQADEGRLIFDHFCVICHAEKPQIQLGAPRIHHSQDWKNRLNQGWEKLFEHTDLGMGAMPPRGGCFECSDKQLKAAIQYMMENPSSSKY
jgi:cytochrome c5